MSPPRYTHYELKLEGDADVIAFLKEHLPERFDTIAGANAYRRAIAALFDGAVEASVISVRAVPGAGGVRGDGDFAVGE